MADSIAKINGLLKLNLQGVENRMQKNSKFEIDVDIPYTVTKI